MDLKEIINRNYDATVRRGLINNETDFVDFFDKIKEETEELIQSWIDNRFKKVNEIELADIIIVCLCMAKHYNIDIQKTLEEKTKFNEKRK